MKEGKLQKKRGGGRREERLEEEFRTEIDERDKEGDFTEEWEVDGSDEGI